MTLLLLLTFRVVCGNLLDDYTPGQRLQLLGPARPWQELGQHRHRQLFAGKTSCRCGSASSCCTIDPQCPAILSATVVPPHFQLDTKWYKKLVWAAGGIPVVGSDKVSDAALLETAMVVNRLCRHRPEICGYVADNGVQMTVMARYPVEVTTDVPEHAHLTLDKHTNWDERARGLGSTCDSDGRVTSCAEENILCYKGDRYRGRCIAVHEFVHSFHERGMQALYPDLFQRVRQLYNARDKNIFVDSAYASSNENEFWAEMSMAWFNCGLGSVVKDRQTLKARVPECGRSWRPPGARARWTALQMSNDAPPAAMARRYILTALTFGLEVCRVTSPATPTAPRPHVYNPLRLSPGLRANPSRPQTLCSNIFSPVYRMRWATHPL